MRAFLCTGVAAGAGEGAAAEAGAGAGAGAGAERLEADVDMAPPHAARDSGNTPHTTPQPDPTSPDLLSAGQHTCQLQYQSTCFTGLQYTTGYGLLGFDSQIM